MGTRKAMAAVCGLALAACAYAVQAADGRAQQDALQPVVRISRIWESQRGRYLVETTSYSLGAWVAPGVLLTHNHYNPALGTRNETVVLTGSDGWAITLTAGQLTSLVVGDETQLIYVPVTRDVPLAPLADAETLHSLAPGRTLDVVTYDIDHGTVGAHPLDVAVLDGQRVEVIDGAHQVRGGSSGGSAYLEGKLVGNVTSYLGDQAQRHLGTAYITLIPDALAR